MGVIRLDACDWETAIARVEAAEGPIALFWMAARSRVHQQWQPLLLTIRGATLVKRFTYSYPKVILGSEQLTPGRAGGRLRKGIVRSRRVGTMPALRIAIPTGASLPLWMTTEGTVPYYHVPTSKWPQFFASWSLDSNGVDAPAMFDPLIAPAAPFFPSLHSALASLAYGIAESQFNANFQPEILIRLPETRARIGEVASTDGEIQVRVDEGRAGGTADLRLTAVWKENATDLNFSRAEWVLSGPGVTTFATGDVPAEMWIALTDDATATLVDRAGWSVGGQPEALGPLDVRVQHFLSEGEGYVLEYKQLLGEEKVNRSFAEAVTAFANGEGGTILVGVTDGAVVVGWDRANAMDMITDIVRNYVTDSVDVAAERTTIEGKPVWVVTVPAQRDDAKPFRCAQRVMVRANSTTRVATTSEHRRLAAPLQRQDLVARLR